MSEHTPTSDTEAASETEGLGRIVAQQLGAYTLPANYPHPYPTIGTDSPQTHWDVAERCGPLIAKAIIAAGWISPTEAATRDAAQRAAGAETALREAADRVRFVRGNGLPDGVESHPTSETFEAWLRERADGIGGGPVLSDEDKEALRNCGVCGGKVRNHLREGGMGPGSFCQQDRDGAIESRVERIASDAARAAERAQAKRVEAVLAEWEPLSKPGEWSEALHPRTAVAEIRAALRPEAATTEGAVCDLCGEHGTERVTLRSGQSACRWFPDCERRQAARAARGEGEPT